jgi:hypothetical protein
MQILPCSLLWSPQLSCKNFDYAKSAMLCQSLGYNRDPADPSRQIVPPQVPATNIKPSDILTQIQATPAVPSKIGPLEAVSMIQWLSYPLSVEWAY